jgi:hypothetical protein
MPMGRSSGTICQHTTTTGKPIAERLATIWLDDAGRASGWQGHCRATGASVHDPPAHHQGQAHCRVTGYDLA